MKTQFPLRLFPLCPPVLSLARGPAVTERLRRGKNKATRFKEKQKDLEEKAGIPLDWCNPSHWEKLRFPPCSLLRWFCFRNTFSVYFLQLGDTFIWTLRHKTETLPLNKKSLKHSCLYEQLQEHLDSFRIKTISLLRYLNYLNYLIVINIIGFKVVLSIDFKKLARFFVLNHHCMKVFRKHLIVWNQTCVKTLSFTDFYIQEGLNHFHEDHKYFESTDECFDQIH